MIQVIVQSTTNNDIVGKRCLLTRELFIIIKILFIPPL